MKYIKKYDKFKDSSVNEEFVGAMLKALGGLIKKAFQNLRDSWKKWNTEDEAKKGISAQLDIIAKNCTDSINKAESKAAIEEAKTAFNNEINALAQQLLKDLQTIKEEAGEGKKDILLAVAASISKLSNLINAAKTGNIAKQIATFQTQKDLANDEKKLIAKQKPLEIQIINNSIAEIKKIFADPDKFKEVMGEYKETNKIQNSKPSEEYKVGDNVIYKREKFDEEQWSKLTDDQKKKPDEEPMKKFQDDEMIGIKKIKEIKGEDVSFEDADFTKKLSDLLGKVDTVDAKVEYKAGDNVIYKREKFNEESWKKITDEDKKKPNEGPMKDLQDGEEIGIKDLKSDVKEPNNPEGIVEFEGFNKKVSDLLGKIEGEIGKVDGQVELQKNLAELKTKKPDTISNIKSYTDFLLNADEESIKTISDLVNDEMKK
jgi:hypothetical protein